MIFNFIRYTQPAWQFNISPQLNFHFAACYVIDEENISEIIDERYQTKSAKLADAGYQLWNKGVLLQATSQQIEQLEQQKKPTLKDEYIFIRKYWGATWATFALVMRIATFKNPFREIKYYFQTKAVQKINAYEHAFDYNEYDLFDSPLIKSHPKVAVIIPTLNRYQYLKDVLNDLEKQSYTDFHVIVVDQSKPFNPSFYNQFRLNINVIYQKEKLLWTARNIAVKSTTAEYILFFDDDSRVKPDWLFGHLKCIDFFKADISAGVSLTAGHNIPESYKHFRWADQFDSGNAMIKRSIMQQIGLFDEQFNGQRMGDGEFGLRAYMNGLRSISNPKASRIHLKVSSGGLRQMGNWDSFRTKNFLSPKPLPSVVYLYKKYFPQHLYRNIFFIGIMLSNFSYRYKKNSRLLLLSAFLTVIKAPVLMLQYYKSNKIANKMLSKKTQIDYLN